MKGTYAVFGALSGINPSTPAGLMKFSQRLLPSPVQAPNATYISAQTDAAKPAVLKLLDQSDAGSGM